MAWNPKTVVGKILKGAVTAAPLALSLVPGIGPAVAAVTGVVKSAVNKGTEKLKAASTILDSVTAAAMTDPVATNAGAIVNGTRTTANAQTVAERDALTGNVVSYEMSPIPKINMPLLLGGGALLALLLFTGKKRRR